MCSNRHRHDDQCLLPVSRNLSGKSDGHLGLAGDSARFVIIDISLTDPFFHSFFFSLDLFICLFIYFFLSWI
jgi:hypothetical protein